MYKRGWSLVVKNKIKINYIKLILLIVMALTVILYTVNRWFLIQSFDNSYPIITFDQDVLEVSVDITKEELLKGVTANDAKNGDVTNTIIIESMSKILDNNERIVTYAAFDGDNHVGKAERRIRYTNYTSPKFFLEEPLETNFMSLSFADMLSPLKAMDCIDGDISNQIIVVSTQMQSMTSSGVGVDCEVQVTNSCGDVASLVIPLNVSMDEKTDISKGFAILELSDYLVYIKTGEKVDYNKYVVKAEINGEVCTEEYIHVKSELNNSQPGVYVATYIMEKDEVGASVDLIIVVEE